MHAHSCQHNKALPLCLACTYMHVLQQVMLIEAVMDTAVHGPEVDTAYLLETESGEDTDGEGGQKLPFYQDIASCNIEVSTVMSAHHLMQLDMAVERTAVFAEMYMLKVLHIISCNRN